MCEATRSTSTLVSRSIIDPMLSNQNERIGHLADRLVLDWAESDNPMESPGPEQLRALAFSAISELLFGGPRDDESELDPSHESSAVLKITDNDVRRLRLQQLLRRAREVAGESE